MTEHPWEERPAWVVLMLLSSKADVDRAAAAYFGPDKAASETFIAEFGIDLTQFIGHYLEVDVAEAPMGPFVKGRVRPIVSISKDGEKYRPRVFSHQEGLFNTNTGLAWVSVEDWESLIGA